MAVVQLQDNVVTVRHKWALTVEVALAANGGVPSDYTVGDYPEGSTRDPETGVITPHTPHEPTTAELVAGVTLRAPRFWIALQRELVARAQLTPQDDVQASALVAIESAEQGGHIGAETAMEARIMVRTATEFPRVDPDNPGLLDAMGALLGLTPADIDGVFAAEAGLA